MPEKGRVGTVWYEDVNKSGGISMVQWLIKAIIPIIIIYKQEYLFSYNTLVMGKERCTDYKKIFTWWLL